MQLSLRSLFFTNNNNNNNNKKNTSKENVTRDIEIKNNLTVTRGEVGGDNGGKGKKKISVLKKQSWKFDPT